MLRKTVFLFALLLMVVVHSVSAQIIRLSGAVVDAASLQGISGVTIKNISTNASVLADKVGVFYIEAQPGDTLRFNSMLHKEVDYVVPPSLSKERYGLLQLLERNGILLEEVEVLAFPTQRQFEQAFLAISETELAKKSKDLNVYLEDISDDPTHMQGYILQQGKYDRLYELVGQVAPNNFLNPVRWERFIEDWREGRFNDEATNRLEGFPKKKTREN